MPTKRIHEPFRTSKPKVRCATYGNSAAKVQSSNILPTTSQNLRLFIFSMLGVIVIVRLWLWFSPHTNLNLGGVNIHHLYLGGILISLAVVLLMFEVKNLYTIILAGISTGLILDELVYLIATDGSDLSYLSTVSFLGMFIMVGIFLLFIGGVYYVTTKP